MEPILPSRDRLQVSPVSELAAAPRAVVSLGTAPDGLPWLLSVDRSRELARLFETVLGVFGLAHPDELPARVREALEQHVAAGLLGVHEATLPLGTTSVYVGRKKLKHVVGPTILSQILEPASPPPLPPDVARGAAITNVGAIAARDQDVELLEAVERSIERLQAHRHLMLALSTGDAWSCAVRDADRALRTPSAPFAPLVFESLRALGGVHACISSPPSGMWRVELSGEQAFTAALRRVHQSPPGGALSFEVPRARLLAKLVEVARGVGEMHRRGRVHADLAPGNILLGQGAPRAFDALDVEAGARATAATFEWAAPEQIIGHPVDPRTDVFALGKIAAALLGGVLFGEETQYVVPTGGQRSRRVTLLKCEGVFVDIAGTGRDRGWQLGWQDLLGRSVSHAPERRPDSAVAFAAELAAVLERHPPTETLPCPGKFGAVITLDDGFARIVAD